MVCCASKVSPQTLLSQVVVGFITYVLAGHTLADNLGVLVDEDVGTGFIRVDATGGNGGQRAGSLEEVLAQQCS